jgi:hypothetical protein
MKRLMWSVLCMGVVSMAMAQTETVVNALRDSTQRDPQIERDAAGNAAIVWNSEDAAAKGSKGDIVLRFFAADGSPIGGELLVNSVGAGDQEKPAAAMNDHGDLVVVWASMTGIDSAYDIMARIYHNRIPLGPEFRVNTAWRLTQTEPDVAIDSTGRFVVVWNTWTDTDDRDVKGRVFAADGMPLTSEFTVNTTVAYSQARPAVKCFRDGSFVVVWESWDQDGNTPPGYGVYGRRFTVGGQPAGGEFPVNTTVTNSQWFADVETFDDDGFAVVWCSWEQDGYDGAIVLQRFAADNTRIGPEVLVNATTAYYQWLPRIRKFADGGCAVVWSSWKQDGSREGVYLQLFDKDLHRVSFETRMNTTTESFQWEPDLVTAGTREVTAVWSSWGQVGRDYEIVRATISPVRPEGVVNAASYVHSSGRTTTRLIVHVVDSTAMTGNTYEARLDTGASRTKAVLNIRNVSTGDTVVSGYPIDRGEGMFYLSPVFEGVAVQVIPEFDLDIDFQGSFFINHSGSNLSWVLNYPTAGTMKTAPIDVALIWGSTDTLANGNYVAPLDSAISASGGARVVLPFRAWNLTDSARVDMVVAETRSDKRWNPGEKIIFLTPAKYRTQTNNTHGEIRPVPPAGVVVMPSAGDTNMFLTTRPIGSDDRFMFTTSRSLLLGVQPQESVPAAFILKQNYPNPFNPTTSIRYSVASLPAGQAGRQLPAVSSVRLVVYDLLGREVAVLVDEKKSPGSYTKVWDASRMASGVYFYRLTAGDFSDVKKMLLLR